MTIRYNLLTACAVIALSGVSVEAFALTNCHFLNGNSAGTESVSFGNIIVQRDAPVGTVLGSVNLWQRYLSRGNIADCPRNAGYMASLDVGAEFGRVTYGGQELFETGVPGVAVRVRAINTNRMPRYSGTWCTLAATTIRFCAQSSWGNGANVIELVKIEKTESGQIQAGEILIRGINNGEGRVFTTNLLPSTLTTVACAVKNPSIQVTMNPANETDFRKSGGTAGKTDFRIDLDCDASTNVNVTLDPGAAGAQDAARGILKLDASASQSASGVGLQILSNGAPVVLGTMMRAGTTTTDGLYSIPLRAQYIQTGPAITPGEANASATFTMTYQ